MELVDILANVSFTTSETERNKNGKYELADELPNNEDLGKSQNSLEL